MVRGAASATLSRSGCGPIARSGAVLDRPDAGVACTLAADLLVCRTIFYMAVAEMFVIISQGSP